MGWVTLSLRKQTLRCQINEFELQDITLSRQLRSIQRHLSYDKSILNSDKTQDLRKAKEGYLEERDKRPDITNDKEYAEWQQTYADAKEDYMEEKSKIEDHYDELMEEIEEEATEKENEIQEEQTVIEAQLEAVRQELEAVSEQISADIQSTKISLK